MRDIAADADSFSVSFGEHALVLHVDQLIFEGGAPCVDYKHFHLGEYPFG
jgi:hypothetical protein